MSDSKYNTIQEDLDDANEIIRLYQSLLSNLHYCDEEQAIYLHKHDYCKECGKHVYRCSCKEYEEQNEEEHNEEDTGEEQQDKKEQNEEDTDEDQ